MKPNPAWRGDPTFLPEVFKLFGVKYRELPGWLTWGMGDFGKIQGVMWHHTGASNTSAQYIARNTGLGGALSSQVHTAPDGLQTLCGVGIAYHAGKGWLQGWRTNMANWDAIGFEMQHNGTDPWPEEQLESTRRATAAILWFLGHNATRDHLISHWEYSNQAQGKWDPGSGIGRGPNFHGDKTAMMDMDAERAKVQALIDNPPHLQKAQKEAFGVDAVNRIITHITDFIKGFICPVISDVKDIRQQLTGGRDTGEYFGWPQLGKNTEGKNLTLVDGVAALRQDVAALSSKIDQLTEGR